GRSTEYTCPLPVGSGATGGGIAARAPRVTNVPATGPATRSTGRTMSFPARPVGGPDANGPGSPLAPPGGEPPPDGPPSPLPVSAPLGFGAPNSPALGGPSRRRAASGL